MHGSAFLLWHEKKIGKSKIKENALFSCFLFLFLDKKCIMFLITLMSSIMTILIEGDRVIINSISKSTCSRQILPFTTYVLFFLYELCDWFSQLLSNMVEFYGAISIFSVDQQIQHYCEYIYNCPQYKSSISLFVFPLTFHKS